MTQLPDGRPRPRLLEIGARAGVSASTVSRFFNGGYVGPDARLRINTALTELDELVIERGSPSTSAAPGRPRMFEVGARAQVSVSTVSRYFNGGSVSSDARERIEEAIRELGYRANPAARKLRANRSDAIGVVALGPQFYGNVAYLAGMTAAARQADFSLVVGQLEIRATDPSSPREIRRSLEQLLRAGVDGVVFATPYPGSDRLAREVLADTPAVVISERPSTRYNTVHGSSRAATALAMQHLIDLGHRRILHLGGDPATLGSREREAGYEAAMLSIGEPALPVPHIDWTGQTGYAIGMEVDIASFSAVFAGNDALAAGFMKAMRQRGLEAPRDYSIVGIDGTPESLFFAPALTTVAINYETIGRSSIEALLRILDTGERQRQQVIAPDLVVRESTMRI